MVEPPSAGGDRERRLAAFRLFAVALMYGLAFVVALTNLIVFGARWANGEVAGEPLAVAIASLAAVFFVHRKVGRRLSWNTQKRRRTNLSSDSTSSSRKA